MGANTETNEQATTTEDTAPVETDEAVVTNTDEAENAPENAENAPESNEQESDEDSSTLSHEDALKALQKARQEAARYRTRLRETESKFADAKTAEEFEAALTEFKAENEKEALALIRENVALRYKLPEDVALTLHGNTKDELEAHAKVLARYIAPNDGDPELQGGLDPDADTGGNSIEDITAQVQRVRQHRY